MRCRGIPATNIFFIIMLNMLQFIYGTCEIYTGERVYLNNIHVYNKICLDTLYTNYNTKNVFVLIVVAKVFPVLLGATMEFWSW